MALSTWWDTDPTPIFPPLHGCDARPASDWAELARINGITLTEINDRREKGHRPYIALMNDQPAGYGWVASREASIGELNLEFWLPRGHRYLWDFATLPSFRGRGIYPRLLQSIIRQEMKSLGQYFWIIHAPENLPSGAGIDRAGFEALGQLSFRLDGGVGLQPFDSSLRAQTGADLLGVPLIEGVLSPCWCCGGLERHRCGLEDSDSCWPPIHPDRTHPCACAVALQPNRS